ncbi:hypothetical protein A2U01_0076620 [Trifolium medium]|uniref:Uncharacterized protein n=1 Tax=Trifolium medium TaxID=97028 RepID=A0A392T5D7_9FABA|nr:hypothetical protein [Trifolium medium]
MNSRPRPRFLASGVVAIPQNRHNHESVYQAPKSHPRRNFQKHLSIRHQNFAPGAISVT